jgi:hypothetical protein
MATPLEYIKENNLAWQPSFNGSLSDDLSGYRGALIVEEGKQLSETRKMPPKIQAKQVIMVSKEEKIGFFTCELESFDHFEPFFEKYGSFLTEDGIYVLYVTDLEGTGTFQYNGITFTAFPLDESSVWNEILELADLEKGDMKRLKKQEEKIETLYDEISDADITEETKSYEAMQGLKGESSKQLMGAV